MEIKNIFDPAVKASMRQRIESLQPGSAAQWGKMNAAQMLAHLQVPVGVALGTHTIKGNWLMKLILPLFKTALYNNKPWKQGLPTDKTFIMTGQDKDFITEKTKLLQMLDQFSPGNIKAEKHPLFGKLTIEQWGKATWKHFDHHLKQFGA